MPSQLMSRRRGAVLPLMAVLLVVLVAIVAITIDSNWMLYHVTNSRNSADLTARSALVSIQGDTDADHRVARARALGQRIYNLNYDRDATFDGDRILFGTLANSNVSDPVFVGNATIQDAVSAVNVQAPGDQSQTVPLFFGAFFNRTEDPRIFADAIAGTRPVDIILCLDASRSMNRAPDHTFPPGTASIHEQPKEGSRWFLLTDTVELFLSEMQSANPDARIGLVTFGGGAVPAKNPSALDNDMARFEQPLTSILSPETGNITDTMVDYGANFPALGFGTSIFDGISTSVAEFNNPNASRHIVLLSDGNQAVVTRPAPIVAAGDAQRAGVVIHSIAFGGNVSGLQSISSTTGGSDFTALSEEELKEAFASLIAKFSVDLVD